MSLSSASNTINALGIFGRLEPELERYFKNLSGKFSQYPENDDAIGTFNHLSIVMPTLFYSSNRYKLPQFLVGIKK